MKFEERFDWQLFFIACCFVVVSIVALYSAQQSGQYNENFVLKQLLWYGLGAVVIGFMLLADPEDFKNISWYLYAFGVLLLFLLVIAPPSIAPVIKGQKSWFVLPGLGSMQPAELMKIFTILALGRVAVNHNQIHRVSTLKSDGILLLKLVATTGLPLLLIMQQPDLGTGLVFIAILSGFILISGIQWKIILPIFGSIAALGTTLIWLALQAPQILDKYLGVKSYQLGRIYSWFQPTKYEDSTGYQLVKAMRAIGSGQLYGKGFGEREVYLPESQTDFIFSIIAEEYGFLGSCIVIILFFFLIYRFTTIAFRANSNYSSYVMVGIIAMIAFHVFQNIGMSVQLLPITGIPLPFISYGGSALLGNLIALGVAFSISYHHRTYMFGD
ncbi:FtsW/RodA/SpoVE family cell cycle protein [Halobacillus sp. ACCC02827]|uniref:FtsW/RodA/SpoVE family cell cycle protein n=1 Tax=Bacillaceae TaxID=186817 RepID=UPI0002A4D8D6|nr:MULTISPECIES: FtsW/RodA/SpoVE family cell cycle protein [Bacillaceae]ELK46935.1 stage V sporulation protein E [Halobacillus sp. BAB-2008]QHT45219.1 rod shape-determining protein RodA [Bacillus sp. SB49]WJE16000.1 FtsW/RodA/SpoVE family cell cycle protein [Halobacillus sp. ACCC02827]